MGGTPAELRPSTPRKVTSLLSDAPERAFCRSFYKNPTQHYPDRYTFFPRTGLEVNRETGAIKNRLV
jgi:hypothetical protein